MTIGLPSRGKLFLPEEVGLYRQVFPYFVLFADPFKARTRLGTRIKLLQEIIA